jgi:hypothetical protein
MGHGEDQTDREMKIRLEREKEYSISERIKVAVEIESDDPSWAMRKAKELLDAISGEEPLDQGEAGADGL